MREHVVRLDLRAEERSIRRALKKAADKARAAGIEQPEFFVEAEVPAIYIMDGSHPGQINSADLRFDRQEAIVGTMRLEKKYIGALLDVGAW